MNSLKSKGKKKNRRKKQSQLVNWNIPSNHLLLLYNEEVHVKSYYQKVEKTFMEQLTDRTRSEAKEQLMNSIENMADEQVDEILVDPSLVLIPEDEVKKSIEQLKNMRKQVVKKPKVKKYKEHKVKQKVVKKKKKKVRWVQA